MRKQKTSREVRDTRTVRYLRMPENYSFWLEAQWVLGVNCQNSETVNMHLPTIQCEHINICFHRHI